MRHPEIHQGIVAPYRPCAPTAIAHFKALEDYIVVVASALLHRRTNVGRARHE